MLTLAATVAAGFADAKLATLRASAPVVPQTIGVVQVRARVVDVASPSAGRSRVLLAPFAIERVAQGALPVRLRLTLDTPDPPEPGTAIKALAILDPPPGPASPGAYDFARDVWFDRLGGVGLALKPVREIDAPRPSANLSIEMAVNRFRWRLAERLSQDLRAVMGGSPGAGLAAAVTTSHEDWLAQDEIDDLRASGLAHMLAIAGLHTAAVTGFVFVAVRLAVAAWPWLALRVSGKKLAACAGLATACAYLALSGAHPPARRAAITASVAFVAILLARRAVSLRSLAVAALIILALQPVAVVEPGFQMSFCASAALVALAEVWPRRSGKVLAPWFIVWPQKARDWALAMFVVSLVAGAATAPFALQHFNRVARYGLPGGGRGRGLARAVAPLALHPFLVIAGWSGAAIVTRAHLFATTPGAAHTLSSAPWPALPISFAAIVFACLWRGWLRWVALPFTAAVLLWPRPAPPLGWIAADGGNAAITIEGRAIVLKPQVRTFASNAWAAHRGLTLPFAPDAEADLAFACDRNQCLPRYGTWPALGAWWSRRPPPPEKIQALCRSSDIVLTRSAAPMPDSCKGDLVIGPDSFARGGAAEIYRNPDGRWRLDWSQPGRGRRPWSTPAGGA